jgi:hypothetical protein
LISRVSVKCKCTASSSKLLQSISLWPVDVFFFQKSLNVDRTKIGSNETLQHYPSLTWVIDQTNLLIKKFGEGGWPFVSLTLDMTRDSEKKNIQNSGKVGDHLSLSHPWHD